MKKNERNNKELIGAVFKYSFLIYLSFMFSQSYAQEYNNEEIGKFYQDEEVGCARLCIALNEPALLESKTARNEPFKVTRCGGWCTAIADAGGALTGAGIGAKVTAGSCPVCIAGGALFFGAAASVSVYDGLTDENGETNTNLREYSIYPMNTFNDIGILHNDLVVGFLNQRVPINAENLYNYFVNSIGNEGKYSIALDNLTIGDLQREMNKASLLLNYELALEYVKSGLPSSINKDNFISDLLDIIQISNNGNSDQQLKNFESRFFEDNSNLDELNTTTMKAFFSVLRNSNLLWNK